MFERLAELSLDTLRVFEAAARLRAGAAENCPKRCRDIPGTRELQDRLAIVRQCYRDIWAAENEALEKV